MISDETPLPSDTPVEKSEARYTVKGLLGKQVLYTARHSETLEPMVVYQALYGERGIWVRPAAMWEEHVEREAIPAPASPIWARRREP